jgi:methylated-DNA-[protein]-cysteine S-methyltransferase
MIFFYDTFTTPLGIFSVACDASGQVLATAFGHLMILERRLEPARRTLAVTARRPERDAVVTLPAREQILAYFAGARFGFDLPLAPVGTAFQKRAWAALARIPFGETRTYRQLAAEIGQPGAARAVGRANALNPMCLIVPCHRVIGADGSLTGFAFGPAIKQRLLDHERTHAARLQPALVG